MDLIAITFESHERAQAARQEFGRMAREHIVDMSDSVVAYKNQKGKVSLDQTVNLAATGAAQGGFFGLLVGLILSIPTGGLVLPALATGFGAGIGALGGKLSDYGIDDALMKELAADLEAGKATLFVLARKITPDKVLERLGRFEGKVVQTSLSSELEEALQRALEGGRAA